MPKWLRRPLWTTAILLFFWYSFVGYKYQITGISGHSMEPTLSHNQWTLMLKKSRFPENWTPSRFDVVGIRHDEEKLCKRIIGLPGDELEIKEGYIYINNKILADQFKEERICDILVDENNVPLRFWNGPKAGEIVVEYTSEQHFIVPEGHVWVIGDNRDESFYGVISIHNIFGLFVL